MRKRQIKKSVVHYSQQEQKGDQRQRSRQKESQKIQITPEVKKVESININSRRAKLQALKKAQKQQNKQEKQEIQPKVEVVLQKKLKEREQIQKNQKNTEKDLQEKSVKVKKQFRQKIIEQVSEEDQEQLKMLHKPVFISKQFRQEDHQEQQKAKQQERRKKNIRTNTKQLLTENNKVESQEQAQNTDSENQNVTEIPNDDDNVNQQYEYELWKIRQLKRIRKSQQERRKNQMEKVQLDRRRLMNNQQIFIQNKLLGSDATDNNQETKYAFMQKYYHRGAFYQDNDDPIFNRDYNLPTPMQMQDKSMLPKILQKRIGNFGKKGQSKHTHLTAEDTSDLNPLTRPDQSLLDSWKKKTAGYKGTYGSNL